MSDTQRTLIALCVNELELAAAALGGALPAGGEGVDAGLRAEARRAIADLAASAGTHGAAGAEAERAVRAYHKAGPHATEAARVEAALSVIELLRLSPPGRELWSLAYAEAGAWARHFSTVRATVSTFLVGISVGVLAFGWDDPAWEVFAAISGGVWVLMIVLLWTFSGAMRTREWHQKQAEEVLGMRKLFADWRGGTPEAVPRKKPGVWTVADAPVLVVLVMSVGLEGAILYRWLHEPRAPVTAVEVVERPRAAGE